MQISWTHFAFGLVIACSLASAPGCSGTPEDSSSFAMPTFGGVPEQWEPEVTAADAEAGDVPL